MLLRAMRSYLRTWGVAVVRGRSMQPTLYDGDRLLVRHGRVPTVGDLVVVRLPQGVVAVKRATFRRDDGWWVERDNPREGVDSWSVGAIPNADVLAVVKARVWPLRRGRCSSGQRQEGSDRGCIDPDG
jgi:signal peptidase I